MNTTFRIFIGSMWQDLHLEREALELAMQRTRGANSTIICCFGSNPDTPREKNLAKVNGSDVYIGIFAHLYGSDIAKAEYGRAREIDIPCLIYLQDESVPFIPAFMEQDPQNSFRMESLEQELSEHHSVSLFKTPDQLSTIIADDLYNLLSELQKQKCGIDKSEDTSPPPRINLFLGDLILGDKTEGGNITVGNITDSKGIAVGESSFASVVESKTARQAKKAMSQKYDLGKVRTLLEMGFDQEDLVALCQDRFTTLFQRRLSLNSTKPRIINVLLEHAEPRDEIHDILEWARKRDEEFYDKYRPYN